MVRNVEKPKRAALASPDVTRSSKRLKDLRTQLWAPTTGEDMPFLVFFDCPDHLKDTLQRVKFKTIDDVGGGLDLGDFTSPHWYL